MSHSLPTVSSPVSRFTCSPAVVTIESLDPRGRGRVRALVHDSLDPASGGLATPFERRITVPGTLPGEQVRLGHLFGPHYDLTGLPERWITRSEDRLDPRCDQFARCPGCPSRHLSPEARRQHQETQIQKALKRHLSEVTLPTLRWPNTVAQDDFRSRAVARVVHTPEGETRLAMTGHDGAIVELARCPAQTPEIRALLGHLEAEIGRRRLPPWDRETETGLIRAVIAQAGGGTPRVTLQVARPPQADEALTDLVPPEVALYLDQPPRRGHHGLFYRPQLLQGPAPARMRGPEGLDLEARLPAWTPQSPGSVDAVWSSLQGLLAAKPGDRILEIGCGTGAHALLLARAGYEVLGVDLTRAAIESAEANARTLGLEHLARFRTGEATHAVRRLLARGARFDRIILHGMRPPFGSDLMRLLPALKLSRLVYLAPSARALAEDLAALPPASMTLTDLVALQQMPGTGHVLTCAGASF